MLSILKLLANPSHPFHYFDIGNSDTLYTKPSFKFMTLEENGINIQVALNDFFK
jgi:secreted Zn-dependent insulinase-like peptidase